VVEQQSDYCLVPHVGRQVQCSPSPVRGSLEVGTTVEQQTDRGIMPVLDRHVEYSQALRILASESVPLLRSPRTSSVLPVWRTARDNISEPLSHWTSNRTKVLAPFSVAGRRNSPGLYMNLTNQSSAGIMSLHFSPRSSDSPHPLRSEIINLVNTLLICIFQCRCPKPSTSSNN
jgi:hypothetical protein